MPLELPCPQCGAILRAPEGSSGRKVRCKKCQHGFRLPGDAPTAADNETSQQLSVVDAPAFTFDTPAADKPSTRSKSKASSTASASKRSATGYRSKAPAKRIPPLVIGLGVLLVIAAIAAGVFVMMDGETKGSQAAASAAPKAVPPVEPAKDKDAGKSKPVVAKAVPPVAPKPGKPMPGGLKLPDAPVKAEKLQKLTHRFSVEASFKNVRKLFVSRGDSPLAVVLVPGDAAFSGVGAKDVAHRYNVETGTRIDSTEIDAGPGTWPRVAHLSRDGEYFVCEGLPGTLTRYKLTDKAKLGEPFAPFGGSDAKPVPLAAAFILDDRTVLVAAKDGRLETWVDGKLDASGSLGGAVTEACFALKPDGGSLIAVVGAAVFTVPVKTLQPMPSLTLPRSPNECYALAWGSGERIAVACKATEGGLHTLLVIARPDDAKPVMLHLEASYGTPDAIDWNGPDLVAFTTSRGATAVVEMESNKPIAVLWPQGGRALHALVGGRHLVLLPDPADETKCLLVDVDFPPDDFLLLRNEALAEKAPVGFLLTPDGFGR